MRSFCHILALPALFSAGCVTHEVPKDQVAPALVEMHEARLLKPYQKGATVLCKTLEIEANPILFHNLALPAGQPRRSGGDGFEDLSWSTRDQPVLRGRMVGAEPGPQVKPHAAPRVDKFRIMIGSTAFVVDSSVRVRRLFRAEPTLTAKAKGHVMVIRNGSDASRFQEVRFAGGRVEAR